MVVIKVVGELVTLATCKYPQTYSMQMLKNLHRIVFSYMHCNKILL